MRKLFSLFAALTLSVGLWAETVTNVPYIDANGNPQTCLEATIVEAATSSVTWGTAGQTTWFVVKGENVQLAKGAICNGDVRLILADGAKLTATGWYDETYFIGYAGIQVSGTGNSLTIYAQSTGAQMGQLIATGGEEGCAAIGGGDRQPGNNITINGGTVEATGRSGAAGIGGGDDGSGSNITINGGTVTATGGSAAAGIGGGHDGAGSNITINGGEVEATGGMMAAGIGGGCYGSGSNITINGGNVTANGGEGAAGIGSGGYGESSSNIYISDAYILKAGADADNTEVIAHSSAQDLGETLTQQYVKIEGLATPYTRSMTIDNWATVCLPYASTVFSGAKFYRVNYYDGDAKLYIEEVSSLEAGQPYIFQATDETVTIEHAGVATLTYGDEQKDRGLQGLFARTIIATDGDQAALSNNAVQRLDPDLEITVPACRAYFDMDDVPDFEQPHSAPLRCIGVPSQTPTGLGQWNKRPEGYKGQKTIKVIENGQFRIVREGKTYNAQGIEL